MNGNMRYNVKRTRVFSLNRLTPKQLTSLGFLAQFIGVVILVVGSLSSAHLHISLLLVGAGAIFSFIGLANIITEFAHFFEPAVSLGILGGFRSMGLFFSPLMFVLHRRSWTFQQILAAYACLLLFLYALLWAFIPHTHKLKNRIQQLLPVQTGSLQTSDFGSSHILGNHMKSVGTQMQKSTAGHFSGELPSSRSTFRPGETVNFAFSGAGSLSSSLSSGVNLTKSDEALLSEAHESKATVRNPIDLRGLLEKGERDLEAEILGHEKEVEREEDVSAELSKDVPWLPVESVYQKFLIYFLLVQFVRCWYSETAAEQSVEVAQGLPLLLPWSFVAGPFIGITLQQIGVFATMDIISIICTLVCFFRCFSSRFWTAPIITMPLHLIVDAFIDSQWLACFHLLFEVKYIDQMVFLLLLSAGLETLLVVPFEYMADALESFLWPNLITVLLSGASFLLTWQLRKIHRERLEVEKPTTPTAFIQSKSTLSYSLISDYPNYVP